MLNKVSVYKSSDELGQKLCKDIIDTAKAEISKKGIFTLAVPVSRKRMR